MYFFYGKGRDGKEEGDGDGDGEIMMIGKVGERNVKITVMKIDSV